MSSHVVGQGQDSSTEEMSNLPYLENEAACLPARPSSSQYKRRALCSFPVLSHSCPGPFPPWVISLCKVAVANNCRYSSSRRTCTESGIESLYVCCPTLRFAKCTSECLSFMNSSLVSSLQQLLAANMPTSHISFNLSSSGSCRSRHLHCPGTTQWHTDPWSRQR